MFQIGSRVIISPNSKYYTSGNQHNPKDMVGIVQLTDVSDTKLPIEVRWENGNGNSYSAEDLRLVTGGPLDKPDQVERPQHYALFKGIEVQDLMQVVASSKLTDHLSPWETHCFLTMLKYQLRAGEKGDIETDLGKARRYRKCLVRSDTTPNSDKN